MRIDLHNHTTLCRHATGTMSEYIHRARELNIDIFGFSCHAPMKFDEAYRMSLEDFPRYCDEINELKKQHKDIEILLGLEADFILGRGDLIESIIYEYPFDYLIGSVHFLDNWGFDNPAFIGRYENEDIESCWEKYLHSIAAMADSGLFQIVGHIDLLKIFNHPLPQSQYKNLNRALESIADNGLVIELNPAGWRKPINEAYPSLEILKLAKAKDIAITFGSDAHSIEHIGFGYERLCAMAREAGYTKATSFRAKAMIEVDF